MSGIAVHGLSVAVAPHSSEIVHDVSFSVAPGEVLGVVGESGCGKTTMSLAVLGETRPGATITAGEVLVDGRPMLGLTDRALQRRRGRDVAYVSQDPAAALNPSLRIGRQLLEVLEVHAPDLSRKRVKEQLQATMANVRLPSDDEFLKRYPHQLSGGQQQRVAIAMAAILKPEAIVLDEPTTGLDVTTQAHILRTVRDLAKKDAVAMIYVSHDLAVVSTLADRVLVLYSGRVVEVGPTQVLARPSHPYTRGLVGAIPVMSEARELAIIRGQPPRPGAHLRGCRFSDRCTVALSDCAVQEPPLSPIGAGHHARCVRGPELRDRPLDAHEARLDGAPAEDIDPILVVSSLSASYGPTQVLREVSLELGPQECVALVGESGSGKTTFGRSVIGLHDTWQGRITYKGEQLAPAARKRSGEERQALQYIFQSPYNALNPRKTIGDSIAGPLGVFFNLTKQERRRRVATALEQVSLNSSFARRYPHQLSGGERQRAAIARALVCEPRVLICDEITSALDVSVQASIVRLLAELRADSSVALLFITHNLALVRSIADRVLVLNAGIIVESGPTSEVLDSPVDPYTRSLVSDTPTLAA